MENALKLEKVACITALIAMVIATVLLLIDGVNWGFIAIIACMLCICVASFNSYRKMQTCVSSELNTPPSNASIALNVICIVGAAIFIMYGAGFIVGTIISMLWGCVCPT